MEFLFGLLPDECEGDLDMIVGSKKCSPTCDEFLRVINCPEGTLSTSSR